LLAEFDEQVDLLLTRGNPREEPLRGDHGFQVGPFGAVLRLPVGFQLVPELGVVRGVFVGEDGGAGAQAVGEGVEADGVLALGCFRTSRCWEFCRLDFWFFSEITMLVILRKSDSGCWGRNAHTRFNDRTRVVRKSRA
jgi:hypothetical protein